MKMLSTHIQPFRNRLKPQGGTATLCARPGPSVAHLLGHVGDARLFISTEAAHTCKLSSIHRLLFHAREPHRLYHNNRRRRLAISESSAHLGKSVYST